MNLKLRRTEESIVLEDNWSLFEDSVGRVAQLFYKGEDDLIGS